MYVIYVLCSIRLINHSMYMQNTGIKNHFRKFTCSRTSCEKKFICYHNLTLSSTYYNYLIKKMPWGLQWSIMKSHTCLYQVTKSIIPAILYLLKWSCVTSVPYPSFWPINFMNCMTSYPKAHGFFSFFSSLP